VSAFFCFARLHLALVGVLGGIKDVHRPLAADSALDNDWKVLPDCLRHRDENTGVVQVFFVCWPANTFLVAFLCAWAFLEGQAGKEQEEACQEDEAHTAGIECCVGAVAGWDITIARRCDGDDVNCYFRVLAMRYLKVTNYREYTYRLAS
jgi:hypothetical protein